MPLSHPVLLTGIGRPGQVGEALARELGTRGARLILVDRDGAAATARARELGTLGIAADPLAADLADPELAEDFAVRLRELSGGRLSAAVLAAGGFAMGGSVAESDLELWRRMLAVNLATAVLTTRAALPLLRPDGALVYFASAAVLPGAHGAGMAAYAVAKAGIVALMRAVAEEERAAGVRANAVAPNTIRTGDNVAAMGADARYVEREDVARVVGWLCEERSVTGQVIAL